MDVFSVMTKEQGRVMYDYVLGLYDFLDRMVNRYPDLLIEGCSGGGGRFDAGMLYYCPQIWCSDDTDARERTKIQYGTSFFYPVSAVGSHVSTVPNHQTGRITPFETRAVTAMAGSFGYELDLNLLSDAEKQAVTEQIQQFKAYGPLIHNGRYYRLTNPMTDAEAIWAFAAQDGSEILVQGMIFHAEANTLRHQVKLRGLCAEKQYRLDGTEQVYTGAALMAGGVLLPKAWGDYTPVSMHFTEV
jgi:alpha-galactosidase